MDESKTIASYSSQQGKKECVREKIASVNQKLNQRERAKELNGYEKWYYCIFGAPYIQVYDSSVDVCIHREMNWNTTQNYRTMANKYQKLNSKQYIHT